MIVEGAVVMIENIVRLLSHPGGEHADETVGGKIRRAAHEVQRPVFYSIAIIITAYLPIFTLQAVEGRLFKPMAWTVAFALLGALIFSMLIGPVHRRGGVSQGHQGVAQPADGLPDADVRQGAGCGHPLALGDRRPCRGDSWRNHRA